MSCIQPMFHLSPKPSPPRYDRPRDARPRRRLLRRHQRGPARGRARPRSAASGRRSRRGPRCRRGRSGPTRRPCASSRGRASRRPRRPAGRRRGTRAASAARSRAGSSCTSLRPKLKTSVPQSGCSPRRGSSCSYRAVPSKRASAQSSFGKCAGHPVEDHADPRLVEPVDERAEVVRRTEARGRREEARHLVAP